MNKAELIDALAERLGDKKVAAAAVAGLVDLVVRTVNAGDKVTITGFGVFEKRARAARVARNPRTGEAVTVSQTDVPAFRPGTLFREVVSGARKLPRMGATPDTRAARPVAAVPSDPAPTVPSTRSAAASRPVTRVTAAARPTAVPVAAANPSTKAAKAATKAAKTAKAAKPIKPAKTTKSDSKATMKTAAKASVKGALKKAGKKAAASKSAAKK
ncbi:MAG: HU family DNA-binding protein [Pseudonocardiaceae bacterium]